MALEIVIFVHIGQGPIRILFGGQKELIVAIAWTTGTGKSVGVSTHTIVGHGYNVSTLHIDIHGKSKTNILFV